ncbi:hypothetical protein [Rhizobium leguminosarum]|jgi:hypothetical protein|nr:hypothetical protein [Rhizobium leguminosarum]
MAPDFRRRRGIADPRHSLVRIVETESLKEVRAILVEGKPFGASH